MELTILTYNIRHGLGSDGTASIERIGDVLKEANADVVCLQEVNSGFWLASNTNQATWLAKRCGYQSSYFDNWRLWPFRGMGNAILTRDAPYSTWNTRLPSVREPRALMRALLRVNDVAIHVACTHWGLRADERYRQATASADAVRNSRGMASDQMMPTILCGDLNVTGDAPEVLHLINKTGLFDTWPDGPPTYAVLEPTARIDYILASPHWTVIERRRIVTDASDHFPVCVRLSLPDVSPVG